MALRVLIVEDCPDHRELLTQQCEQTCEVPLDIVHVDTVAEAVRHLGTGKIDVTLCDLMLPESPHPIDTIRHVCRAAGDTPVVVMSSVTDRDTVRACADAGARFFYVKDAAGQQLAAAVHFSLRLAELSHDRRQRMADLAERHMVELLEMTRD